MDNFEKIEVVLNHITNVQKNCYKLGIRLMKAGQVDQGRLLIANGLIHDNSKFKGIEFDELFMGSAILKDAIKHHNTTNMHHPECWGSIQDMPNVYLAEMVCDCYSRSTEFGQDIRVWFADKATAKYNFTMDDKVGKKILYYLDMLLEKPFSI